MNKNSGFTLLEVVLALSIMVASFAIIYSLQSRSFSRVWKSQRVIERIFFIKTEFCKNYLDESKKTKPKTENIEELDLKIKTEFSDIDKKSELKDFKDDINILKVQGEWSFEKQKESLTFYAFVPKIKESK